MVEVSRLQRIGYRGGQISGKRRGRGREEMVFGGAKNAHDRAFSRAMEALRRNCCNRGHKPEEREVYWVYLGPDGAKFRTNRVDRNGWRLTRTGDLGRDAGDESKRRERSEARSRSREFAIMIMSQCRID